MGWSIMDYGGGSYIHRQTEKKAQEKRSWPQKGKPKHWQGR